MKAASIWTVRPEERTLELSWTAPDGEVHKFWIKVKKQLTVGEQRRVQTAGWRGVQNFAGGRDAQGGEVSPEISIDWRTQTFARTEAYLTDWSLEDEQHNRLPVVREVFEALHPDLYTVIENAITAHVQEVAQEKKPATGAPEQPPTSA